MDAQFAAGAKRYTDAASDDEKKDAIILYDAYFQSAVADVTSRTAEVDSLEQDVASLEAELACLENAEIVDDVPSVECGDYYHFLTGRSKALGTFHTLESALAGLVDGDSSKICGTWAGVKAIGSDDIWAAERSALEATLAEVAESAARVNASFDADTSVDSLSELLGSIDARRPGAVAAASSQALVSSDTAATRAEMEAERVGLLTWCRQQKTNLDAMVEPDHAQEFCSSMLANFASMDKNFQVLLDFTNQLPGDDALQRDMLECNEVWLNLQVSAYERMRHALLEVHPKSKLEDEVREFVSFSDEILDFINKVRELFSNTNDPESDSFVRPVIDEADILLSEYGMHEGLPRQLQEFCSRMDCLRDGYSNLRRAVLSRLTFLTSSVPALTASMRRKEEYVARMRDLKAWVEVKSQGETWSDIHERILSIKSLIEQEQVSLNDTK